MIDGIRQLVRDVPNFPRDGIVFKDITPVLSDPAALALVVELMANPWRKASIDFVVGAESRGFIFGTAIAQSLSCGFIPARKRGKLPRAVVSASYDLEYGTDEIHMHADAMPKGARVLIADDLLATGGTMIACIDLVRKLGGQPLAASVFIELSELKGRAAIAPVQLHSVIRY
ncbi:MAG: adenine phosphoribosyltransferase [Phycisphaerales bacterium]|nr:adenine phosphoribosyltransferase [Phycisphaerales bacterium]